MGGGGGGSEWSCYGGGQFKGGSGHVIVFSLMERE